MTTFKGIQMDFDIISTPVDLYSHAISTNRNNTAQSTS